MDVYEQIDWWNVRRAAVEAVEALAPLLPLEGSLAEGYYFSDRPTTEREQTGARAFLRLASELDLRGDHGS